MRIITNGNFLIFQSDLQTLNLVDVPFVCFDGDKAGQESSKKIALKILEFLSPGKSFKFIILL